MSLSVVVSEDSYADGDGTISYVSYDLNDEKLSFTGTTTAVSNGTATMTLKGISDSSISITSSCSIASGGYDGKMSVGVLERGTYKLTATANSKTIGERVFSVTGLISIGNVSFDPEELEVTFIGKTNLSSVNARIIGSYESDFMNLTVTGNAFSGSIGLTEYKAGSMILSVTESMYHCESAIDVGSFIVVEGFDYDSGTHTVSWNGYTTENSVSVELFDGSNARLMGAFSNVTDGTFSGSSTVALTDGTYKLKVTSISDVGITDELTQVVSNIIVGTTSETDFPIYTGEYEDVAITVANGTYSDLIVQSENSEVATVGSISSDGKLRIFGQSPGATAVRVYAGQSEVVFNVTVTDKVLPPEIRQYTFVLKINDQEDAEKADVGTSGLSVLDLLEGITLVSNGYNAGEALEDVLNAHGIPCSFWSGESGGQMMKHWVNHIMNLDTISYPNGDYKYWIQYQGTSSYNQWTLGYYTEGGTFTLVYGITDVDGQVVRPDNPVQHTHSWDAGTVTKEPTCTEAGEKTYTCSCGETKTEALPSLGHDWSDWILITDATTEHDGLKERTCSRCGEKESMTIPKIVVTDNADGSQTKTEELIDGTEVTTTIGTETAVTAVSEDGTVSTTASSDTESKELVTEVKADETDGSCTVSNDTVQTAIRQQEIVSDAIGDSRKEKVLTITSATENVSASLEKGSLSDLAENDVNLRVASTQGSMTFGKDVLTSLSEKDDVTLSFTVAERSDLTESQKETIEIGSTVVSLTAMSNGQSVGRELGGKVTVVVKHTAAEGKDAVAYYVDGEGNRTKVAEQYYDAEKGEMTMVLDHFSIYVITDEEPEQAVPYILYGLLAFIVVVCLGIMFPQVFGRKQ